MVRMSPSRSINDFLSACERGDKKQLSKILQGDTKVAAWAADEDGHTGLQVAAANDQVR